MLLCWKPLAVMVRYLSVRSLTWHSAWDSLASRRPAIEFRSLIRHRFWEYNPIKCCRQVFLLVPQLTPIRHPFSQVTELSGENVLLNANRGPGDVGATVTVGIATCTQAFDAPRKRTLQEIAPGFVRLVCEFDYTNSAAVGSSSCDYSQCFYVEEPEFPLSGTPLR